MVPYTCSNRCKLTLGLNFFQFKSLTIAETAFRKSVFQNVKKRIVKLVLYVIDGKYYILLVAKLKRSNMCWFINMCRLYTCWL